jgi:nucleoside-diphosphate-sugar epimerase
MRRCLVTGAAGSVGRAVLDALRGRDVPVTAMVLHDSDDLDVDRVVVGDLEHQCVADEAMRGAGKDDVLVHLAARPSPVGASGVDVFAGNTRATFAVLDAAARAGVRRAVIASSLSVYGFAWGGGADVAPVYLPVDEYLPMRIADPYALSKQADEQTAAMIHRRDGMDIVALRLPLTAGVAHLEERVRRFAADPSTGARELWSYLHLEDAADAVLAACDAPTSGVTPFVLAAPTTLSAQLTADLVRAHLPSAAVRGDLPGRHTPIDSSQARHVLGFAPHRLIDVDRVLRGAA